MTLGMEKDLFDWRKSYGDMVPEQELQSISKTSGVSLLSEDFSHYMDGRDPIAHLRDDFIVPKMKQNAKVDSNLVDAEQDCIYMCGNSLGLQPKKTADLVHKRMNEWATQHILCDEEDPLSSELDSEMLAQMATIVGAKPDEVTLMNALTVNMHLMMISFYRPTPRRHKILIESKAFPSDHYVAESQIRYYGFDPATSLIALEPREGEETLRTEDILSTIENEGESIMLILLPGVQYYTGQLFEMEKITKAGHNKGCWVTFDIAHAVGNAELHLHDWGVDFACWCTYKYLNSGPGSIGGAFLHQRHKDNRFKKFLGPWGSRSALSAQPSGIREYEIEPPNPNLLACLKSSLDVISKTSLKQLRAKSFYLSGYLEFLIKHYFPKTAGDESASVRIITPTSFRERGAQLSLVFSVPIEQVFYELTKRGVMCDVRKPNVIRVAPVPIYCRFHDVYRFVEVVKNSFEACRKRE